MTAKLGNVAIASDICEPLINMYLAVRNGWEPPEYVSRENYETIKVEQDPADPMTAFVGFWHAFGGKWFAGYRAYSKGHHMPGGAARVVKRDVSACTATALVCSRYDEVDLRPDDCVYLDPPYANTTAVGQRDSFDHTEFWHWCRDQVRRGVVVLVSEMSAPEDFAPVLTLRPNTRLGADKSATRTEHVFRYVG